MIAIEGPAMVGPVLDDLHRDRVWVCPALEAC
jgi:hypothetical protein